MKHRGTIFGVSVSDVRLAAGSAVTLFALLAGHTVLEVARDALFLASRPVRELPFTYLGIAFFAWIAVGIDQRLSSRVEQRRLAMGTLLLSGAGTVAFYFAFGSEGWWVPHAFYIWTGLVSTFAVAQFWRLIAELFTVIDAKRLYSRIAAGGSLGAVAGAGLADLSQIWLEPHHLLLLGGALLGATAFIPRLVFPEVPPIGTASRKRSEAQVDPEVTGYVRRLVVLIALTSITALWVDFVFKSTVGDELAPSELARFFSRFYVGLNVASLLVQLVLAPRILMALGATRAVAVLPILFALGAAGFAFTGVFALAVMVKGADGGLRHSLHRSAFELLYLPLSKAIRTRYKTVVDALGQRGGQAIGSLGILAAGFGGLGPRELAIGVSVLSTAWVVVALALRKRYLDLFRANLRAGSIETRVEIPALDLSSLESLMASLNSPRDDEVLATLDVLRDYDRVALLPALLLYHPSSRVVLRTLELLAASPRTDYLPIARRLLEREDEEIQAAAMHAMAALIDERELREELAHSHVRAVRAAVLVALVARGLDPKGEARGELMECARGDDPPVRLALARAIRLRADLRFADLLDAMANSQDPELVTELAIAYGSMRDPVGVHHLIKWLGPRYSRVAARDALRMLDEPAYEAMVAALADPTQPLAVRGHLPKTIARFHSAPAARALFAQLLEEADGWVAFKILRALRPLREAMPDLRFDERELTRLIAENLERAARILSRRVALVLAHEEDPTRRTQGSGLLEDALADKETQALDRAVRLVALLSPEEDLRRITNALQRGDRRQRAESRELLSAIAPNSVAPALDALLADAELPDRLSQVRATIEVPPVEPTYEGLMTALLEDESEAVRAIAAYHVGELHLVELREDLARASGLVSGLTRDVLTRALEDLDAPGPEEVADA